MEIDDAEFTRRIKTQVFVADANQHREPAAEHDWRWVIRRDNGQEITFASTATAQDVMTTLADPHAERQVFAESAPEHQANCPWCRFVAQGMMRTSETARDRALAERLDETFGFVIIEMPEGR